MSFHPPPTPSASKDPATGSWLTLYVDFISLSSRAHVQAVLQNPAFKANPFAAIREHAGNSLVMIDKQVKA